jgi:hypothetical protein
MKRGVIHEIGVCIDNSSISPLHPYNPEVGAGWRVKLRSGRHVVAG